MNLREALVVLIEATVHLPGADVQGNPLFSARCQVKWRIEILRKRELTRMKRMRRGELVAAYAKGLDLDPTWARWHKEVLNGHAKKRPGGFRLVREKISK